MGLCMVNIYAQQMYNPQLGTLKKYLFFEKENLLFIVKIQKDTPLNISYASLENLETWKHTSSSVALTESPLYYCYFQNRLIFFQDKKAHIFKISNSLVEFEKSVSLSHTISVSGSVNQDGSFFSTTRDGSFNASLLSYSLDDVITKKSIKANIFKNYSGIHWVKWVTNNTLIVLKDKNIVFYIRAEKKDKALFLKNLAGFPLINKRKWIFSNGHFASFQTDQYTIMFQNPLNSHKIYLQAFTNDIHNSQGYFSFPSQVGKTSSSVCSHIGTINMKFSFKGISQSKIFLMQKHYTKIVFLIIIDFSKPPFLKVENFLCVQPIDNRFETKDVVIKNDKAYFLIQENNIYKISTCSLDQIKQFSFRK